MENGVQLGKVLRMLKTPATLLLLLAILGYGAYWGYRQVTLGANRSDTPCVTQEVGSELRSELVSVRVLNGGERGGAAKNTRFFLLTWGYEIVGYTNSSRDVDQVTVVGNSADDPEVRLVASAFKNAVTEGDGRVDHVVDVILPTRFTRIENPPTTIPVHGPVCLPKIEQRATPTPSVKTPSASKSAKPK